MSGVTVSKSKLHQNWKQRLEGEDLDRALVRYKDADYFWRKDEKLDPETPIYEIVLKAGEPKEGHLNWGYICLYPGKVDDQYFCTRGHFNSNENAEEYLLCMQGDGLIMFMNEEGHTWCEVIEEGSLHHVEQKQAYRLINLGDNEMLFSLCTPANTTVDRQHLKEHPFDCHIYDDNGDLGIFVENPIKAHQSPDPDPFDVFMEHTKAQQEAEAKAAQQAAQPDQQEPEKKEEPAEKSE